jgi:hypothetical protein
MLICNIDYNKLMGSKVVSTKLTEEEYGKLVGLCSASGFTVSKLLKRAILERMNEKVSQEEVPNRKSFRREEPVVQTPQGKSTIQSEDKFQYY